MGVFIKIVPNFIYYYRNKIVKHIVNNALDSRLWICNNVFKSDYCTHVPGNEREKCTNVAITDYNNFNEMIESKRNDAKRSLVVQVSSENSCHELQEYCHKASAVQEMHYYRIKDNHFVLVEFADCEALPKICFDPNSHGVTSPFVWFRSGKVIASRSSNSHEKIPLIKAGYDTSENLIEWMMVAQSLSDEMEILYKATKLSEIGIKLRMICARQVEMMLSGLFPSIKALPFGSSVNAFGKEGCDLDIVLHYDLSQATNEEIRLVYQSKVNGISSRGQIQRHMELIADILQIHAPGARGIKRILGARVPIIKYSHDYTGVEIDISLTNLTAVYMSELLYLFAKLDSAAQTLVFSIKAWAKAAGLTNPTPGRWISNFSLTLLAIFYLQMEKRLPSVDALFTLADQKDARYTDNINCSFVRDLRGLNLNLDHRKTTSELLAGFFNFYQDFDFNVKGINLCTAKIIGKPDFSPMYIVNPLERTLNVSKNVSADEVERLRIEARNATWMLETGSKLSDIFLKCPESLFSKRKYTSRMVAVKDLFQT